MWGDRQKRAYVADGYGCYKSGWWGAKLSQNKSKWYQKCLIFFISNKCKIYYFRIKLLFFFYCCPSLRRYILSQLILNSDKIFYETMKKNPKKGREWVRLKSGCPQSILRRELALKWTRG